MADELGPIEGDLVSYNLDENPDSEGVLGNVESFADGVYTIKSLDGDTVEVPEDKVVKLKPILMMNKSGHGFRS
ncbi:hypothetical protein TWF481_008476 [Arthrobotrys musiformis]|uniref:Hypervirulence associated protein TUDOR domain-containing protein n=1 Tax=Arthrobotrys musiformis TaxID=47236 RepID=A0AAV9W789_9PEZI